MRNGSEFAISSRLSGDLPLSMVGADAKTGEEDSCNNARAENPRPRIMIVGLECRELVFLPLKRWRHPLPLSLECADDSKAGTEALLLEYDRVLECILLLLAVAGNWV